MLKNHDIVFAEALKVSNMKKNSRLAKAISDVAWSQFLSVMEKKAEMHGKTFIKVSPCNTTQTCSHCGYVMKGDEKIKLGVNKWVCPSCNTTHTRDHNAAINILNKGLELLP